ncbi:DUF732 domain-containing protein [Mycobacterium marseillense]|uniref:DUF732 domain-containing protein n=1 Tax=Mycobacterium marseillense TaxID=701042 RepID=UPI0007FE2A4F|nr:DUF732 domain-containing protein [Mycobacterium marseillense]MCA2265157.1 DUF732 domain-containing protein [Mycobacterium marseillense]MDM3976791.1 DUF732 domain-containing protein [Mycobacterium marseillense]OBJ75004.1 hypothetical protein A5626_01590 [Mycobacterium marseillense]
MKLLFALAGLAVTIGLAAPAHADGTDDAFIASLRAVGITFADPDRAVGAGKWVCDTAGRGEQMPQVVATLRSMNSGLSEEKANQFAAIAANTYCPNTITSTTNTP